MICGVEKGGHFGMALKIDESNPSYLTIRLSGKLTAEDYEEFVPKVEAIVREKGSIRILMTMHDFHGWKVAAAWEDTKFGLRHFHDIERLAMVGDKAWQHGMAVFCKPFTKAEIRYFDLSEIAEAEGWISA
jgi:hypothetical protein